MKLQRHSVDVELDSRYRIRDRHRPRGIDFIIILIYGT